MKLAQKVAAYLASPLGYMENLHGPEGLCWYYDKDGKPHLTALGKKTAEDATVELQSKDSKYAMYNGIMFLDGCPANYTPYYASDINPDSGETFDISGWSSEAESRQQNLRLPIIRRFCRSGRRIKMPKRLQSIWKIEGTIRFIRIWM